MGRRLLLGVVLGGLACGTSGAPAGSGSGGTPDGGGSGPGIARLMLHLAGSGDVRSASPAFDCRQDCTQELAQGTRVTLIAVPDAGSRFSGWAGACSGAAECTVTLDGNRDVTATFAPLPPPPPGQARVSVQFTGNGSGRVTSNTGGIDCPGICSISVANGTPVTLTAAANSNSTFAGWGGACSGGGVCNVSANGDPTVWANFQANGAPPPPPPPPPTNSCAGIAPPDRPVMQSYVYQNPGTQLDCLGAAGDAHGHFAFARHWADGSGIHVDAVDFVSASGQKLHTVNTYQGVGLGSQPDGMVALSPRPPMDSRWFQHVVSFDGTGIVAGSTFVGVAPGAPFATAVDPNGGLLFAGDLTSTKGGSYWVPGDPAGAPAHGALMLNANGRAPSVRWGVQPLASSGPVFGVGVDLLGRSLVITGGAAKYGPGTISAQWFDRDGSPLTGEFELLASFTPGASTWFETTALIGGGLLVRRMDTPQHATALVVVTSGTAEVKPAPDWMVTRKDVKLQIARGGKAYAVLPLGAPGVTCTQRVEVVAPDGTSCGSTDYAIGEGTCDTPELLLTPDGTLIQQLPLSMEWTSTMTTGVHNCTWRWWPNALR